MLASEIRALQPVEWNGEAIAAIDQRLLPHEQRTLTLDTIDAVVEAIAELAVRGAPTLGAVGALAVLLSTRLHTDADGAVDVAAVRADAERVAATRPTAVNLAVGVERGLMHVEQGAAAVQEAAEALIAETVEANLVAARRAAEFVREACPQRPLRALTHCNAGPLATLGWGTALGAIRELAEAGALESVLLTETRPLLQGARLTAWELRQAEIPHRLCPDSAAVAAIARGLVDCVFVGADRIAANGDVANKVGTYALALAAHRAGIPFVVVAPASTVDPVTPTGADIVIEQRAAEEVSHWRGEPLAPHETEVYNPAFDVTPFELISAVSTERGFVGGTAEHPRGHGRAALEAAVAESITLIDDFPKPGVRYRDLAGVYAQAGLLPRIADAVVRHFAGGFDAVVAIEARGFPLGALIAHRAHVPLTLLRKAGKLPGTVRSVAYDLEYGSQTLELQHDALAPNARVLLVDDVLATGGTLAAAADLVRDSGASVAGCAVIAELPALGGRELLHTHEIYTAYESVDAHASDQR